jgi:hypothetical protein
MATNAPVYHEPRFGTSGLPPTPNAWDSGSADAYSTRIPPASNRRRIHNDRDTSPRASSITATSCIGQVYQIGLRYIAARQGKSQRGRLKREHSTAFVAAPPYVFVLRAFVHVMRAMVACALALQCGLLAAACQAMAHISSNHSTIGLLEPNTG